jgi:hypothetical protein
MVKDQYKYFRIEARELLGLKQAVLDLERGERGKGLVGRLLRFAHTLEGCLAWCLAWCDRSVSLAWFQNGTARHPRFILLL